MLPRIKPSEPSGLIKAHHLNPITADQLCIYDIYDNNKAKSISPVLLVESDSLP